MSLKSRWPVMRWGAPLAVVLVIGGGAGFWTVWDNRAERHEAELLCQAINGNRAGLRNLLVSARTQGDKLARDRGTYDSERARQGRKFFREEIAKLQPLDCGNFDRNSFPELRGGGAASGQNKSKQPP